MSEKDKQPDWDKITEGKIRHGLAVEAFAKGMDLDGENMKLIEKWVQFIIHGYDTIKDMLDENDKLTNGKLKDAVIEQFDGEILDSDEYVNESIQKAITGLDKKNKNKVLYQLKNGNITTENLSVCLGRIEELKKA